MAIVNDAPQNLRMSDFLAHSSTHGGVAKTSRFAARIMPRGRLLGSAQALTRDLMYLCEIMDMPGRAFQTFGVRYYGPMEYFPTITMYDETASFTFICRNASFEREFFDNWMTLINPIHTFDFNYRDDYSAEIDLFQFADVGDNPTATYKITLQNAYPSQVHPQPMQWSEEGIQKLVVSFSYTKWIRKGIDPTPRTATGGKSFNLIEGRS